MHRKTSSLEGSVQLQEDYNKVLTAIEFMASSQAHVAAGSVKKVYCSLHKADHCTKPITAQCIVSI